MSARFDIKMEGAERIRQILKELSEKEAAKIAKKTTRKVCKDEILPAAKASAGRKVGGWLGAEIEMAMALEPVNYKRTGGYGSRVVIKATDALVHETKDGYRYFIPSAIEYGHAVRGRGAGSLTKQGLRKSWAKKIASSRKDVPPNPFMRAAYESKRMPAATKAANDLKEAIESYFKKTKLHRTE